MFISVILPTYKRLDGLKLSLNDILNQTFLNFEVLICDDNLDDEVKDYLSENISDERVIYIGKQIGKKGLYDNFLKGYERAKGELIMIAHDDNRYASEMLAALSAPFKDGKIAMCYENTAYHKSGDMSVNEGKSIFFNHAETNTNKSYLFEYFIKTYTSAPWGTAMFRKSCIRNFNDLKKYSNLFDVYLWIYLEHNHKVIWLEKSYIHTEFRDRNHWNYFHTPETDILLSQIYIDVCDLKGENSDNFVFKYFRYVFVGFCQFVKHKKLLKGMNYVFFSLFKLISK